MGTAMLFFNNPDGVKKVDKKGRKRIVIGVPKELHRCIGEIMYRKDITFRQYMLDAITDLKEIMSDVETDGKDKYAAVASRSHSITFSPDELVHPSVIIPVEKYQILREVAHYGKPYGIKSFRQLVIDILYSRLDAYKGTCDDVINEMSCKDASKPESRVASSKNKTNK